MKKLAGNETFEKLGTLGTSSNLLVYLTSVFHMKTITATNLMNIFNGTCNFGTLIGAYLSDTYFGRYKTIGFASVASFLVTNYSIISRKLIFLLVLSTKNLLPINAFGMTNWLMKLVSVAVP